MCAEFCRPAYTAGGDETIRRTRDALTTVTIASPFFVWTEASWDLSTVGSIRQVRPPQIVCDYGVL